MRVARHATLHVVVVLLSAGSPASAQPPAESDPGEEDSLGELPLEGDLPLLDDEPGDETEEVRDEDEPSVRGELFGHFGLELRLFPAKPASADQPRYHNVAAAFQPGYVLSLGDHLTMRAILFARLDEHDPNRTHFDAREALLEVTTGRLTLRFGLYKVFWGVTESRHLVDIVNQTDFVEDIDGDEKLGQLMAMTSLDTTGGVFSLFAMSWFRPQVYPSVRGRPGVPIRVLDGSPLYDSDLEEWHVDVAFRWSHHAGPFDWALGYFYGTSRDPQLLPAVTPDGPALQPHYDLIHQGSLELQLTLGGWLVKAEALVRAGQGPAFAATTVGFEYTFSDIAGSGTDLGVLLEYSYDGRDNLTFYIHDNDAFGGFRLSFNDEAGTELLVAALTDVESGVTAARLEASRRFGEHWKLTIDGRVFFVRDQTDPLYWFRRDHYLQTTMEYHF